MRVLASSSYLAILLAAAWFAAAPTSAAVSPMCLGQWHPRPLACLWTMGSVCCRLGVSHFAESISPVPLLPESAPVSQISVECHSCSCIVAASASFYCYYYLCNIRSHHVNATTQSDIVQKTNVKFGLYIKTTVVGEQFCRRGVTLLGTLLRLHSVLTRKTEWKADCKLSCIKS